MKFIAITLNGLEGITNNEIKEVLKAKIIKADKGKVVFDTDKENFKELRSAERVLSYLGEFKFKDFEDFGKKIESIDFSKVEDKFKIECKRVGEHDFNSVDISKIIGSYINKKYGKGGVFKDFKQIVYISIFEDYCYIGIDLTGKLSRRDYRIKVHASSINANLAYSMIRLSNFKDKEILLDPFCGDGVICIEAALLKKGKVFGIDKRDGYIRSCRINSKIAKADVDFSINNIEWLDTRFKKNEVDKVVSSVPYHTKRLEKEYVSNVYREFFNHLNYVLKKKGLVVLLCRYEEPLVSDAKDYGFILKDKIEVKFKGYSEFIFVFEKDLNNNVKEQ
ncbi:MAG: methyltransferase domain-containing protein [Candidatus Woesearchaeota archaeon]|nr:MAG: methyltransferase domain-containing protein [Candidatus Woesearchaeota archaeon]